CMGGRKTSLRINVELQGRYLELRTEKNFNKLVKRIKALAPSLPADTLSALMTDYLGYSLTVQIDNHYRLTIPKKLRALLGEDELILIGVGEALQIWGRSKFFENQPERRAALRKDIKGLAHAVYGIPGMMPAPESEATGTVESDA
ncbi:MAG: hypothetical protein GXP54_03685, partial [Deltaproteobacteria bacterium]|nr:hypothetical protein [Deltaproteobacteria bacterium]